MVDTHDGLVKPWQIRQPAMAHWGVECKFCGSESVVRFGATPKGTQRFLCRACNRSFVDNNAPPSMRFPVEVIALALNHFYKGHSLSRKQRLLLLNHELRPDPSNIYRWVVQYSKFAARAFDGVPIRVGDVWVADETVLKLKHGNTWLFDCIDRDTRFLLASHLTPSRYTRDAQTLMERAEQRAGKAPKVVITDKLRAYLDAIEKTFGADTYHHRSGPFEITGSSRDIERFHGTLMDRTKVMRSLANRESARLVLDGWLVHYNFFRPHGGLGNKTPAQVAGAEGLPFENWTDVVRAGPEGD